jgi:hypothetical protein
MFPKSTWQRLLYTTSVLTILIGAPQIAKASTGVDTQTTYIQETFANTTVSSTQWHVGGTLFTPCLTGGGSSTQVLISSCSSTPAAQPSLQIAGQSPGAYSYLANSSVLMMSQGLKITFNESMASNGGQMRIDLLPSNTTTYSTSGLPTNSLFSIALDALGTSDTETPSCNIIPNSVSGEKITVRSESVNSGQGCIIADTSLTAGSLSGSTFHRVVIQIDPATSSNPQVMVSIDGSQKLSINEPASLAGLTSALFMMSSLNGSVGGIQKINNLVVSSAPAGPLPSAPMNLAATPQDQQVKLTWSASPTSTVTTYTVTATPGGATCTTANLTCIITGLTNGIQYHFDIFASSANGNSSHSTPQITGTPGKVPGVPRNVTASASDHKANISWSAATQVGAGKVSYYVVNATNGGGTCTTSSTSCGVSKLTDGLSYSFTVTAVNNIGSSSPSSPSNSVVPVGPPDAPAEVKSTNVGRNATITWQSPSSNGATITSYKVFSNAGGFSCSSSKTSCTIQGLQYGKTYAFTVKAINRLGASPSSLLSNSVTIPQISVAGNS